MNLLEVQDLNVQFHDRYAGQEAVQKLSFHVGPGEIVGIVGESGSGKSTGMHALLGLLPDKAEVSCKKILFEKQDITPPPWNDRRMKKQYERTMEAVRGNKIAMVFQDPLTYLNPTVKIGRQITETIRTHKSCSRREATERAAELLDMVGIRRSAKRLKQYPFELSGGMRQRVVIAIALACEPRLLIADEPTTALDVTVQGQILDRLKNIAEETGTAILFVSHDLGVIASICRRVLVMQGGRLIEEGTVEDIFYEPKEPYTRKLLSEATGLLKLPMVCQKPQGNPLLKVEHVSKYYEEGSAFKKREMTEAVHDVSLTIGRGESYGLVGESGCGKSTLAGMVTGIIKPTGGRIRYEGGSEKRKYPIQMVFQDPYASLNPRMTIQSALEEPLILNTGDSPGERKKKVEDILSVVGLSPTDAKKYPHAFSGGQRQRIGIARALILEPELLVCDEPVSALDVSIQEQILSLLEQIRKNRSLAYLFISHDLNVVKRISRRMGVMYAGSLVETGGTKEIYEDPWHPYTKALLSAVLVPDPWKARRKKAVLRTEEKKVEVPPGRGCPFAGRCGYALSSCFMEKPEHYRFDGREIACFLYSEEYAGRRTGSVKMTSQI